MRRMGKWSTGEGCGVDCGTVKEQPYRILTRGYVGKEREERTAPLSAAIERWTRSVMAKARPIRGVERKKI